MSNTVILARHGETDWRFRGRLQGVSPVPLNEHGQKQAEMLADYLEREYGELEAIYTSDLLRAKQTALIVRKLFDEEPDFVVEETLREQDWGDWQGMKLDVLLDHYPAFDYNDNGEEVLEIRPPNGESMLDVHDRVIPYWKNFCEMVGTMDPDYPILVISHSHPINSIMSQITGETLYTISKDHDREPIELTRIGVNPDGNIVDYSDPEPPWSTT